MQEKPQGGDRQYLLRALPIYHCREAPVAASEKAQRSRRSWVVFASLAVFAFVAFVALDRSGRSEGRASLLRLSIVNIPSTLHGLSQRRGTYAQAPHYLRKHGAVPNRAFPHIPVGGIQAKPEDDISWQEETEAIEPQIPSANPWMLKASAVAAYPRRVWEGFSLALGSMLAALGLFGMYRLQSVGAAAGSNAARKRQRKLAKLQKKTRREITKGTVGPRREVPASIRRPEYANTDHGQPDHPPWSLMGLKIDVKNAKEIEAMRVSGRIAREVLDEAIRFAKPGVTTDDIDAVVHAACIARNAYPSPLNYNRFPKSVCTSINEVICHGIPDSTVLQDGDLLNIDVTIYHNGYHGDCSETICIGTVDPAAQKLVKTTWDAWQKAISIVKPGTSYAAIGKVIEEYVTPRGYTSSPDFCGHGIGKLFHTHPNIHHVAKQPLMSYGKMVAGHTFTIEPMICEGKTDFELWEDGWTATTRDLGRSVQFEHTILVTEDGYELLTGRIPGSITQPWEKEPAA